MTDSSYSDTALHYFVDDLPGAILPGARLQNILECLRVGRPLTQLSLAFLQKAGLAALHRLAIGQLAYDSFREAARAEQVLRLKAAEAAKLVREDEARAHKAALDEKSKRAFEQAEAARHQRESDPKYIAKRKQRDLRARYGIDGYVEEECFGQLMEILKRVDAGRRLCDEDILWLSSAGDAYFTEELRAAYHRLEADFFAGEFEKTRDPWAAVNASSHYRKCSLADRAGSLLEAIDVQAQKAPKLKSALCTTKGGVMRDLERWSEALRLGEQAHELTPDDCRTCTLLGAVHMEIGDYGLGQEWYAKAVELGATVASVDQELRSIFFRADQTKQAAMREFLLQQDHVRYAWVKPKRTAGLGRRV